MNCKLYSALALMLTYKMSFSQIVLKPNDIAVITNVKSLRCQDVYSYKVYTTDTSNIWSNTRLKMYIFKNNKIKRNWLNQELIQIDSSIIDSIMGLRFKDCYFDFRTYNRKGEGIRSEAYDHGKLLY